MIKGKWKYIKDTWQPSQQKITFLSLLAEKCLSAIFKLSQSRKILRTVFIYRIEQRDYVNAFYHKSKLFDFLCSNWDIVFQKVKSVWQYVTNNFNEKIWCWKNDVLARNLSSGNFLYFFCVDVWLKIDIFQQTKSFFATKPMEK